MGEDSQVKCKHYKEAGLTSFHFTLFLNYERESNPTRFMAQVFFDGRKVVGRSRRDFAGVRISIASQMVTIRVSRAATQTP